MVEGRGIWPGKLYGTSLGFRQHGVVRLGTFSVKLGNNTCEVVAVQQGLNVRQASTRRATRQTEMIITVAHERINSLDYAFSLIILWIK